MDTNKYQKYYITVNGIPNGCTLSISGGIITESKVADETGVVTIDISPLLETNWIILPTPATYKDALRISPDGMLVQHKDIDSNWHPMFPPDADNNYYVQCYRAGLTHGRKVAEAEHEALREQVKELVEAVRNMPGYYNTTLGWVMSVGSANLLSKLAKAVQL